MAWEWALEAPAHSDVYDFDWANLGKAVALADGSIFFVAQESGVNVYAKLSPPYEEWFTAWGAPNPVNEFGEVQAFGNNAVLIGGQGLGSGGLLYHGDLDLGEIHQLFNEGPGAGAREPYGPWDVSSDPASFFPLAWDDNLDYAEVFLQYFASAVDRPRGRVWQVGPRRDFGTGPYNFCGFLDVPDGVAESFVTTVPWIRTADLPPGAGGDTNIEAHSACCDSEGRLYVGGGSGVDVVENRFRRYTPGPPVGAGVHEVQRFEQPAPGWTAYEIRLPHVAFQNGIVILETGPPGAPNEADDIASLQVCVDAYCAAYGIPAITVAGAIDDFTFTYDEPGMRERWTSLSFGHTEVLTVTIHGTGYPTTNTWEELDPIPGDGIFRGAMIADKDDRIYYIGGLTGLPFPATVGTIYRYTPDDGWETLEPLPDGFVAATTWETAGENYPAYRHGKFLYVLVHSDDETETRLARYSIAHDTWTLSEPTNVNHLRGGFVLAGGRFWVLCGDDGADRTAVVESIDPALPVGPYAWGRDRWGSGRWGGDPGPITPSRSTSGLPFLVGNDRYESIVVPEAGGPVLEPSFRFWPVRPVAWDEVLALADIAQSVPFFATDERGFPVLGSVDFPWVEIPAGKEATIAGVVLELVLRPVGVGTFDGGLSASEPIGLDAYIEVVAMADGVADADAAVITGIKRSALGSFATTAGAVASEPWPNRRQVRFPVRVAQRCCAVRVGVTNVRHLQVVDWEVYGKVHPWRYS